MTLKTLSTIVLLAMSGPCIAQKTNVIFFAETGENFTLLINGAKQNATPQSNVKVEGIQAEAIQVLITFEKSAPQLKQLLALEADREMTFAIKKNNKGAYVIRVLSVVDIPAPSENLSISSTQTATPSNSTSTPPSANNTNNNKSNGNNTTTEALSLKISAGTNEQNNSASINIEVGGVNTSIKTETISATITASPKPVSNSTTSSNATKETKEMTPCATGMGAADYERAKKSIEAKSFAEEQLTICKQIIKVNCLTVAQVAGLMELFTFEEHKLSVAKMAYPKTIDQKNYYQLNDAFEFSASVDELNQFIEKQ